MKQYIFKHKDIQGGVPAVLEGIKKELGEMIKHTDCPLEEVENKLTQLSEELIKLGILLRKNPKDEKLKPKIDEIKTKVRTLTIIVAVKQKIEELTNYGKSQQSKSEKIELQIDVFECNEIGEESEEEEEEEKKSSESAIGKQCIDYMKYAEPMPECFEKSLIRICYLLQLLQSNLLSGGLDEVKDGILKIMTKDEVLKNLDNDLTQIIDLYEEGKIDDASVEQQMTQSVKSLKGTKPEQRILDQQQILLLNLLSKVRPFNFQEFFQLVEVCDKNSDEVKGKDIILLLGTTGAGKSTTIQYLFGANMVRNEKGHIQARPMPKKLKSFIASAAMKSETRYINPIEFEYTTSKGKKVQIIIVDTPGFGDTQSIEVDIANSLAIIRAVIKANSVRPVFIFNQKNMGQKSELMKQLIDFYSCMIKNLDSNIQSMNFFFSHFADLNQDMGEHMVEVNSKLNALELSKLSLRFVLEHMEKLGKEKKLLILDPLDTEKRVKVLEQILATKPIQNPKKAFTLNILERSRAYLDKQVSLQEKSILEAVSQGLTQQAAFKIDEINRLAVIFEPYDQQYKIRLQQINISIRAQVSQKIGLIQERICTCMKPGNQLYESDINKFKEALDFEKKISPLMQSSDTNQQQFKVTNIQCDQQQSTMVTDIVSHCTNVLAQLDRDYKVSDDEWFLFIKKSMVLSANIDGFQHIKKNALDKFDLKFYTLTNSAQEILKKSSIDDYQPQDVEGGPQSSGEEKRVRPNHQLLGDHLINLFQGLKKIKQIPDIDPFTLNLEKYIDEVLQKVSKLTKSIEGNFQLDQHEDGLNYRVLTEEKLKKIKKSLEMLEKFMSVCKPIDLRFYQAFETIFRGYVQKCENLFEIHQKFFEELQKNLDTKKSTEVNSRFKQIDLLRQIPQIVHKTNGPYHSIISQLKNSVSFSKTEILSIIEELNYFSEQQDGNMQGLNLLFRRLKEALTSIKTLGEAATQNSDFKMKMYNNIKESFESLVKRLEQNANMYVDLTPMNHANIRPLANIYEQVIKIEELSAIINVEVKTEIVKYWLQSIKSTVLLIHKECEKLSSKLMDKADYKALDNYYRFINELCQVQNSSSILRIHINLLLQNEQFELRIDGNLLEFINQVIKNQKDFKKKLFNLAFDKLCELTEVSEQLKPEEEQKEINVDNNFKEIELQIRDQTEVINKLFKLENDVRNYYDLDYYKNFKIDIDNDPFYFLDKYTRQLKSKFFEDLQRPATVNRQSLKWKYLKLQSLKYLKDIDSYLFESNGQYIQQLFDSLYDQVHFNPPEYLNSAQNEYKDRNFQKIQEMCADLNQPPVSQNSANILNKIKNYLSDQVSKEYQQILRFMPDDNQLKIEEASQIAQQCKNLMEINSYLGDYILIQGKKLPQQIEAVFQYLADCFTSLQKKIDASFQQNNFFLSFNLINESLELMKVISKEKRPEIQEFECFKNIKQINDLNPAKINEIKDSIQNIINIFLIDDEMKFTFSFSPKSFCENISQIKNDDIQDILKKFKDALRIKYATIRNQISTQLENSEDIEVIYNIEQKLQKFKDSLTYVPAEISTDITILFSDIIAPHRQRILEKQTKAWQELKSTIIQSQCPKNISSILEQKKKLIQNDKTEELKTFISSEIIAKFNAKWKTGNLNIEKLSLQEAIQEQILPLSLYTSLRHVQDYVSSQQKQDFYKIVQRIAANFTSSLKEFTKYFSETYSERGERIFNGGFQEEDHSARNINLKVLQGVFASLRENKDLVLRECVPDLEFMLNKFFIEASEYLRKMRIQHQNSLLNKMPEENIAAINNMKFTAQVFSKDLIDLFKDLKDVICTEKCSEFLSELYNTSLEAMQNQTYDWLQKDYKAITDLPFTEKIRDEQARIKFYREVQLFYDIVTKARATEELSKLNDQGGQTKIQKLKEIFQNTCITNIKSVVQKVAKFNQRIKDNDTLDEDEQEQFGMLYKSLKTMLQTLQIEKNTIENGIEDVEGALKRKLLGLQKDAKQCYVNENQLDLRKLSFILCDIQQMNENLVLFEESINKSLNLILEEYQKARVKFATAAADLQKHLQGMEGSQGTMLAANHPFFRGVNILQANQQFQSKKIDDVLPLISGTDLKDDDKDDLKTFYEEFLGIYTSIVDEMLVVRYDASGKNKLPMDFSGMIGNIKNIFSSDSGKKWTEGDIQDQIEWGNNGLMKKKITLLLAHIFALWSLMNSEDFKKQQEQDGTQTNLKGYLLQPHVAQILSILRMMGVGYSEIYRGGSDFNKNWAKIFGTGSTDNSWIRNNLVQIKTGEGKSVVLAVVSIIFALNGFEVSCACYSKYLSNRDYERFYPLFLALGLQKVITYGTFNEIAEKKLNQDGEIREIIQSLVLKEEYCLIKPVLQLNRENRPQLLLIDEVDIFFSSSFYGRIYIPQAQIKHENISNLTDYIWKRRQQKIEEQAKADPDKKEKFPYLSLKELKETTEYKNALNLFKPEFQFLVEEAAKKMIIDVVEYQSPDHLYVIHQGEIGYENQDQISTNITIGYQTLYTYYHRNKLGEIKDDVFQSKKAIGINCSSFSYAEVPLEYNIILGVTGTLQTLSEPQKNIINDVFKIHHQTLSPSVHSSDESRIFNPKSGVRIILDASEYYMNLINEIAIYLENGRPVILFFEHNKSLQQFMNSENFKDKKYSYQILNELDSNQEKRIKVLKATQAKTITLSTKNFGRGTDFCCYDQKVIEAGGLVVIQTFLSEDLSEETQIRGRTGRQGTKGTYIMFLNLVDLSKFNIELPEIENSGHYYKTLCEFRDRKLAREQQETTKNRDTLKIKHDLSINMLKKVKQILMNDPNQCIEQEQQTDEEKEIEEEVKTQDHELIDQEKLSEYLLEMNKGITLERSQHFMKVLVLMDATGSMGITLQKIKNSVHAMFKEARNALKEMGISEDLILMKIGGYRNYNSPFQEIFQVSPEWTSNPTSIAEFLNSLEVKGGWGNEAMEIGLQYANKEIQNDQGIPLSMVIIIGDAPPNTIKDVEYKRIHEKNNVKRADAKYWQKSQNYKSSTNVQWELKQIKEAGLPVHSFYVLNEKVKKEGKEEEEKALLKAEFTKLAVNDGKCAFLDIHDELVGQKQLKDFFKYLIVYRATEINLGKEKALESVDGMEVAFT